MKNLATTFFRSASANVIEISGLVTYPNCLQTLGENTRLTQLSLRSISRPGWGAGNYCPSHPSSTVVGKTSSAKPRGTVFWTSRGHSRCSSHRVGRTWMTTHPPETTRWLAWSFGVSPYTPLDACFLWWDKALNQYQWWTIVFALIVEKRIPWTRQIWQFSLCGIGIAAIL